MALADNSHMLLTGSFVHHDFSYDDFRVGVELSYENMVFLRGGYAISPDMPSEESIFTYTVGGGVNFNLSPTMSLGVDYAYRASKFLDNNQVISVKLGL